MNISVPTVASPDPITIPAQPEKTYPDVWINNFSINVTSVSSGFVRLELLPYNDSTEEILTGVPSKIILSPLSHALSAVPEVQTIFDILYGSISAFATL